MKKTLKKIQGIETMGDRLAFFLKEIEMKGYVLAEKLGKDKSDVSRLIIVIYLKL